MSKQKDIFALYSRLAYLGFTYDESVALRRIEMTLHRWCEQECGDSNDFCSWSIERDETSGKPFRVTYYHNRPASEPAKRYPIADKEAGALRRLRAIVAARNARQTSEETHVAPYYQGDCRGCALYIVRESDVPADPDNESEFSKALESFYTRGLAVCA